MKLCSFRSLAVAAALASLALIPAATPAPRQPDGIQRLEIHAQAIESFDVRDTTRVSFGALTFRGGLVLESSHRNFGGLSGMQMMPDGRFLAVTDKGYWVRGRLVSRDRRPIAIADAEIAPIIGPDGRALNRRGWYDAEALTWDGVTAYVGIERVNEIVRFDIGRDGLLARGKPVAAPPAIKTLPYNQSIECVAMPPHGAPLAGTLIVVSERGLDAAGNLLGFLIGPAPGTFTLKRTDDFDVSDCAVTPRGDLLVLERRFSWLRGLAMRIRSVPLRTVKPGALVDGAELIFADLGNQIDNMEGLSVHREQGGALVLTLVSDDNFSPLQRTLLLQFTMDGE